MKKVIALWLVLILALVCAGCSKQDETSSGSANSGASAVAVTQAPAEPAGSVTDTGTSTEATDSSVPAAVGNQEAAEPIIPAADSEAAAESAESDIPAAEMLPPAELTGPVTATLTFDVNESLLPLAAQFLEGRVENASDVLTAAVSIVENTTLEGIWDGSAFQLNVLLKGKPVAYAAVSSDGETVTAVSDVFPNGSAVQASAAQLLNYYGDQPLNLNVSPADLAFVEDTAKALLQKVDSEIASRTDDPESGSWTFEGTEFTSRRRISATPREISIIALKAVQEAIQDPEITAFLARFGVSPESLHLDSSINGLENSSDEYYPTLEIYRYSNGSGDTFTAGTLTTYYTHYSYDWETGEESYVREPGSVLNIQYGNIGQDFSARITRAGSDDEIVLKSDSLGYSYDFTANIASVTRYNGMNVSGNVHITGTTAQNGERDGQINVQVMYMDVLSINYAIRAGGTITASFDTTGKQLVSFYEATNSYFVRSLRLADIAGKVMNIMPDEAAKLAPLTRKLLNR